MPRCANWSTATPRSSGWEYVERLAVESGIDPDYTKAVRRFYKKRNGRATCNKEWVNRHDPDAKVGMTKHGTYLAEH